MVEGVEGACTEGHASQGGWVGGGQVGACGAVCIQALHVAPLPSSCPNSLSALPARFLSPRDDYALNKALRRQMRGARKEEQAADSRRRQLGLPDAVKLLPGTKGDALLASAQHYGGHFDSAWRHSRRQVAQQSIFSAGAVAAAASARQKKRPGGGSGTAAAAAAAAGGAARLGEAAAKQRRLAGNVKLRLSEPKPGPKS